MSGLFISIEGVDGSGKSSLINRLSADIKRQGFTVVLTREPGGTPVAESIRQLVLNPAEQLVSMAELLLFYAARSQHVETVIKPALKGHSVVICDRFIDASIAYQGRDEALDESIFVQLNDWCVKDCLPDVTLLLDLPITMANQRLSKRQYINDFDSQSLAFHEQVRRRYLDLARINQERIKVVDAQHSIAQVVRTSMKFVRPGLQRLKQTKVNHGLD